MRLINAEALAEEAEYDSNWRLVIPLSKLERAKAVDAAPVVHAHWDYSTCSHCGHDLTEIMDADSYLCIGFDPDNYVACPFCGAKMDEENKA